MNRLLAILAGSTLLTVAGAAQATAQASDEAASAVVTRTCVSSYRGVVVNELCAVVYGDQVTFTGTATPSSVAWSPRAVPFRFTASVVGGLQLGALKPAPVVRRSATEVGTISGVVPCGSTAEATIEATEWGWPPSIATLAVPANC
ncbi:hypothetical protein ACFVYP_33760 [Kitasatospora sp. NPDC058201]|uniref:hypothetical protein n=1 Tax=Streptomycetaceae TaxID=2062 RepID=UPI002E78D97C|nr:hypothetical protein [Streptomyces sp. BE303]MED7951480.1 hypothetical protein [Streptomyces sp. BE303]